MKLDLTEDHALLADSLERLLASQSTGARIRAAESAGIDRDLWKQLCGLGVPLTRVASDFGGGDGTLLHAILAAETAGRHLASAPLLETLVANRLLAQLADAGAALLSPDAIVTLALADTSIQRRQTVPAASLASAIVYLEGESVGILRPACLARMDNLGAQPLAVVDFGAAGERQLINGAGLRDRFLAAIEEYKLLQAAMIASAARRAVDIAAEYAKERVAFGKPIGAYQGVSHPLADSAAELDGAILLARRAADEVAKGKSNAGALIAMANWFARTAGPRAVLKAMRVFGGYGMTMDYDAQLYYRRVNTWSLLAGDPEHELATAASRLWLGATTNLPETGEIGIDFDLSPEAEAVAQRARAFAAQHIDDARREKIFRSLDTHQPDFNQLAAKEGLYLPDWPKAYGGAGVSGEAAFGVREAFSNAGWEDISVGTTDIVGKIIAHFGGEQLKRDVLPRLLTGESYCALGYTEPSGGSDVFGARTMATRDGDDWLINGQKIFTSQGHLADYALLLARTNTEKPKHQGLTLFVVPLRQKGFQVTEIKTVSEERTNITFYENVRVADAYRIGEVDGALRAMARALEIEQSGGDFNTHELKWLLTGALGWAHASENGSPAPMEDRKVRLALAKIATSIEVQDVLVRRCVWATENGAMQKAWGPMSKLYGSEAWLACAHKLMAIAAPASLERRYSPLGVVEKQARRSIPGTIYGGTSEVQRSIIAEAGLGLPRSR
jgi:alkylation response protein AidB-like acyl-CoA dehydrogenase